MNCYSEHISLNKNFRGVYELDTSKGCSYGMALNKAGCYGECYANRAAKRYGINFSKTIYRNFKDIKHINDIRNQIYNIDTKFIRVGVTGDPSSNWEHTLKIINLIGGIKPIILITKHWKLFTNTQLNKLAKYNLCINTSISALDNTLLIKHRLNEYNRLKSYCKSVLRVVSCDFNTNNLTGMVYNNIQEMLFSNSFVIDNVLRVNENNPLVKMDIIKTEKHKFLSTTSLFSKKNKNTFTGFCKDCPDQCGLNCN
jgi:hypothetical protein